MSAYHTFSASMHGSNGPSESMGALRMRLRKSEEELATLKVTTAAQVCYNVNGYGGCSAACKQCPEKRVSSLCK